MLKLLKKIKLFDPKVGKDEEKAITNVLHSGFWASGAGTGNVAKFEEKFGEYIGSKKCVAVNSGTAALNLALSLYDIKNKEVIVPSITFVSTIHAIILNGGKPIFVDLDPKTLCMDTTIIEKKITKHTKMILPVHFAGIPANLKKIKKIANQNELIIVEDAAHATGSTYENKKIGSHGNVVCFSFHPVKNLAMPTGGAIALNQTDYKKKYQQLCSKRWCGITNRKNSIYDVKEIGWNYYMNEFSASIGLEQLKKLEKFNRIKRNIARKYDRRINVDWKIPYSKDCSYHLYWIIIKNRTNFMKYMNKLGIETGIHYRPIHTMSLYKKEINLPITDIVGKSIVSLPIHPNLTETDTDRIIKAVNDFV